MSILDELKIAHPESVLQRMSQYAYMAEEYINTMTNCTELSAEKARYTSIHRIYDSFSNM
jgi:hypothetical protein